MRHSRRRLTGARKICIPTHSATAPKLVILKVRSVEALLQQHTQAASLESNLIHALHRLIKLYNANKAASVRARALAADKKNAIAAPLK
jgi:hypothetical protein